MFESNLNEDTVQTTTDELYSYDSLPTEETNKPAAMSFDAAVVGELLSSSSDALGVISDTIGKESTDEALAYLSDTDNMPYVVRAFLTGGIRGIADLLNTKRGIMIEKGLVDDLVESLSSESIVLITKGMNKQ